MRKKLFVYLSLIIIIAAIIIAGKSRLDFSNPVIEIPNIKKEVKPDEKRINISAVGDLLFESPLVNASDEVKNNYFSLVKEKFVNDDISIGNMEVVIGNDSMTYSGDGYNFCAPPSIGSLVTTLDFEVLSTANNHTFDRGESGVKSTLDFFKNNSDILTVGTYYDNNHEEKIIEKNGLKIGFISYTLGTNMDVTNEQLVNIYRDTNTKEFNDTKKQIIKNEVDSLKNKCDIIIALMHWGNEFTFKENEEQKSVAKYLNSIGVNVIIGSHSHSIQPIEIIKGENNDTLVYYSMGNFVSADDDIARTEKGYETFDNAYQFGLYTNFDIVIKDNNINFENIKTDIIVNYFDTNMSNFKLIPFDKYNNDLETTHLRYNLGLTKDFIDSTYKKVINEEFRK